PQRIVLDPQASKLLLGCLGPIRRARGHLASFLPRLEHPRLDRATGDAKIGRDLGIRHIGMSLVQRDGVGFELIGVLLLWHGFYSHSPAHYGPDSACPPLRVHPRGSLGGIRRDAHPLSFTRRRPLGCGHSGGADHLHCRSPCKRDALLYTSSAPPTVFGVS